MRFRFWLGFAVVAAIAIGSVAVALVVNGRETDNFERVQRGEAIRSARQAEAVAALSVGQLASAAAFYQLENRFTQHEFEVMADPLLSGGALSTTAFIQSVRHSNRDRFERERGFPILERSALGDLRRARDRPVHFPLTHAATTVDIGIQTPLGYDLGTDPLRASNLLRARDKGIPSATSVIRLPVGGTGINVFRPVYRDGAPTDTVAQRRDALIGFATGGFHVGDLAAAATTALPNEVDVQLVERGRTVAGPSVDRDDAATAPLRIADRTWLLVVRNPNRPGASLPVLIAVFGISIAALLGALVLMWSRNERMQELRRHAHHDSLTGLKNRRRFEEDLRTELARSRRDGVSGALLMLDLDNFKQVNDTLGHPMGDLVIGEIAGVLQGRMRETDVLARLGGDEFAMVLPHCKTDEARGVADEIATAIREHVPPREGVPQITASVGIAMFGSGSQSDFESVMADADAAMYEAKEAGRDAVRVSSSGNGGAEGRSRRGSADPA